MKYGFLLALIMGLVALALPSPAHAQKKPKPAAVTAPQQEVLWDWWFVYGGGTSPSREVIYIDSLSVEEVTDHQAFFDTPINTKLKKIPIAYTQADGVSVSENPEKPARVSGRVRVKCDARQMMFDTSYHQYWDADRFVTVPSTAWFDIGEDLRFTQIAKFICEPKARNDKNMMMRADQTSDPLNVTWAAIWNDVKKPEFTTKKTREQIDAEYEATLAKAKKLFGDATADAEKRLKDMDEEEAFMIAVRRTFQSKDKKFHTLFYSMPGWDEAQITNAWGAPVRAGWDGDTRFLVYRYQDTVYDQVQTTTDIIKCQGGGCGKVGETTNTDSVARAVSCERYLYLRPGGSKDGPRLVDYGWSCS